MIQRKEYHLKKETILDDRYVIGDVLGEGGFGITYEAVNSNNGHRVAIKEYFCRDYMYRDSSRSNTVVLTGSAEAGRFESDKARFLKEARTLRDFSGLPGIVKALDQFEENGTACLVMDLLEGETLKKSISDHGPLEAETAFRMMLPVIKTLAEIHKAGVIHRDISPDNIMVGSDGKLTLMDFGAAKEFSSSETTHSMIYKDGYAAREQLDERGQLGPWTDIYSLCATLFFSITGQAPLDSLQRVLHDEQEKPSALGIRIPPEAEDILMKGLRLRENERWQSMDELCSAITAVYPDKDPDAEARRRKWRRFITAAAVLAAAVILFFTLRYYRDHEVEFRFRNIETETTILKKPDGMTDPDFVKCSDIIRGRVEAFSGKNNYLWNSGDGRIEFTVPLELYGEMDPNRLTQEYICRPMAAAFATEDGGIFADADEGEIENAVIIEGELPGLERARFNLPSEGTYPYLELTLSERIAGDAGGLLDEEMALCYMTMDYVTHPNYHYYWRCLTKGDGRTLFIVDTELQNSHIRDLFLYDLLHARTTDTLEAETSWPVRWENPETSLLAGKYQCQESDFEGKTVLFAYDSSTDKRGQVYSLISVMKDRLDSLEAPYAFGVSKMDSGRYIVKISSDSINELEARILGSSSSVSVCSTWDSLSSIYSTEISPDESNGWQTLSVLETVSLDGEEYIRYNMRDYEKDSINESLRTLAGEEDPWIYLCADSYYRRIVGKAETADALQTAEDGYILFRLPDAVSDRYGEITAFLLACARENPYSSASLADWQYLDEDGRISGSSLSLRFTGFEDAEAAADKLSAEFSDENTEISLNYSGGDLDISISGLDSADFPVNGLSALKEILMDSGIDSGVFSQIDCTLTRSGDNSSKMLNFSKNAGLKLMGFSFFKTGLSDEEWDAAVDYLTNDPFYSKRSPEGFA